jgi:hypothetical protein
MFSRLFKRSSYRSAVGRIGRLSQDLVETFLPINNRVEIAAAIESEKSHSSPRRSFH